MAKNIKIRDLEPDDWAGLWTGYLRFYKTGRGPDVFAKTFERLRLPPDPIDPAALHRPYRRRPTPP